MAHWFDDPRKVRRVHRHIQWYYMNPNSVGYELPRPKGLKIPSPKYGKKTKNTERLIVEIKRTLGYLKKYQTWGTSLDSPKGFDDFIDAIHHPTTLGPKATERGKKIRAGMRRPKLSGVKAKAQACLDHPGLNLTCYDSPTGGTAAVALREVVKTGRCRVPSPEAEDQGRYTKPDERILDFLLDLGDRSRSRPACITCIVNGDHSEDSQHYDFEAVDTAENIPGIHAAAAENGLLVLDEDENHDHVHTRR